ncbi:HAD-IA family hydrolase, partial [Actinotalea sp. C106]|uniref:HAD-IA family hydrolase n=1 Tax=Actinotalea sp. C106 TaxID=2908644 RepID=UPI0020279CDD
LRSDFLHGTLAGAGHDVAPARLAESLTAGLASLKHWKHAMSRTQAPRELTHRELWEDFLLADQPEAVRATAAGDGAGLMAVLNGLLSHHQVRPGVLELLTLADQLGVPVGIVSNAHSGRAHRDLMRHHGLAHLVAVQLYSDEVGIRKPHPDMIRRAATALGTAPEHCWYVGDTRDRDLVAGRRAGVGAVVLTRSKHTDSPPFAVQEIADLVLETPEGLVPLLAASRPRAVLPAEVLEPPVPRPVRRPRGLLLDQGGVLTASTKTPAAIDTFVARLAARLRRAGHSLTDDELRAALRLGREAYAEHKQRDAVGPAGLPVAHEVTHREFWGGMVGSNLALGPRAWLEAEASSLAFEYAQAKSRAWLREGVEELLTWCREVGLPVAIVSNTICGRSGRRRLVDAGVDHLVGAHLYSDEVGRRKPDPELVHEATRALGVDPADCWFVGDKPWRDVVAGRAAGVGSVVV